MASARLEKAYTGANGNMKKWTISVWIKRAGLDSTQYIFGAGENNSADGKIAFNSSNQLYLQNDGHNGSNNALQRDFVDTNAWYHIVWRADTDESANDDRWKLYINGELQAASKYGSPSISSGGAGQIGKWASQDHWVGDNPRSQQSGSSHHYFDGQMAHFHYCDGYAYDASSFGESDSNGVWKPKLTLTVTYGTNGFFLKFDNDSNMGLDSSNNTNNLTTSGTIIQNKDTPSNVYCVLNTNDKRFDDTTLTNLNLTVSGGRISTGFDMIRGNLGADSGKWYFEMKAADNAEIDQVGIGILNNISMQNNGASGFNGALQGYGVQMSNGYKVGVSQSGAAYMGGFTTNDICMIAVDLENDKITFGRNGQWANGSGGADQTYANSTAAFTGLNDIRGYIPMFANRNSGNNNTGIMHFNFGNGYFGTTKITSAGSNGNGSLFEYDVPTGFYAWNTSNLRNHS